MLAILPSQATFWRSKRSPSAPSASSTLTSTSNFSASSTSTSSPPKSPQTSQSPTSPRTPQSPRPTSIMSSPSPSPASPASLLSSSPKMPLSLSTPSRDHSSTRISQSASQEKDKDKDKDKLQEQAELDELNTSLERLCTIFPDVRPEVFREVLASLSPESRLQLAVESMLRYKRKMVRGRWRLQPGQTTPDPADKPVKASKSKTSSSNPKPSQSQQLAQQPPTPSTSQGKAGTSLATPVLLLPPSEKFRTPEYKNAVTAALYLEFKRLSNSTIRAVLAEHNYSYTNSRPTLLALDSKSWRSTLASLFSRKGKASSTPAEQLANHPLLLWQKTRSGTSLEPLLKYTASEELNAELEQALIVPFQNESVAAQLAMDRKLAEETNEAEAEEAGAVYDCGCCFTSGSFETMSSCSGGAHFLCHRCVGLALTEALFGQGWTGSVDANRGSLKCFAALGPDAAEPECAGCIPRAQLKQALCMDREGRDLWYKFDERLSREALMASGLQLVQCPFCTYAELHEPPDAEEFPFLGLILLIASTIYFIYTAVGSLSLPSSASLFPHLPSPFQLTLAVVLVTFLAGTRRALSTWRQQRAGRQLWSQEPHRWRSSILIKPSQAKRLLQKLVSSSKRNKKIKHKQLPVPTRYQGTKFVCRNSGVCGATSCLQCLAAWTDPHLCHRSSRLALRTHIESAVTEAIKRTCPKCNVSFVKASGCNKLVCVCGYAMCYVCRREIGPREGYLHFCPHFRPNPGEDCAECDRCDLYRTEDEDAVIRRAKARAVAEWKAAHQRRPDGAATALLDTDIDTDDVNDLHDHDYDYEHDHAD